MANNMTCEHKYKIGRNIYCAIRVDDCGFCTKAVNKCKDAIKIDSRNNRVYYSFERKENIRTNGDSL